METRGNTVPDTDQNYYDFNAVPATSVESAGRILSQTMLARVQLMQTDAADSSLTMVKFNTCWFYIAIIIFASLEGSLACGVDQVKLGTSTNYTCVRCADCPHGMEPSIPCGGLGRVLECKSCKEGTYSSAYGRQKCDPCTICGDKRVIRQNCTAQSNSVCGACRAGFYPVELVTDCLQCSPCCGDGKDVRPPECRNIRGRQCEKRHSSCPAPSAPAMQVPHVTPTSPTAPLPTSEPTNPSSSPSTKSRLETEEPTENSQATEIAVATAAVVLVLLGVCAIIGFVYKRWNSRRRSRDAESGSSVAMGTVEANRRTVFILQGPRGDLLLLCDLESASRDVYDRTLKRLDKRPEGKGHFKEVAIAFQVAEENIFEFEKELQRENGSPSMKLLEFFSAERPKLTVMEFSKVLQLPQVNRRDIVQILQPLIFKSNPEHRSNF